MKKKRNKKSKMKAENLDWLNNDSDGTFYFIAGYTSGGAPYGITWEDALRDGLIQESELPGYEEGETDEHPFV